MVQDGDKLTPFNLVFLKAVCIMWGLSIATGMYNVHFKGYAMNKLLEQIECPDDLKKVKREDLPTRSVKQFEVWENHATAVAREN